MTGTTSGANGAKNLPTNGSILPNGNNRSTQTPLSSLPRPASPREARNREIVWAPVSNISSMQNHQSKTGSSPARPSNGNFNGSSNVQQPHQLQTPSPVNNNYNSKSGQPPGHLTAPQSIMSNMRGTMGTRINGGHPFDQQQKRPSEVMGTSSSAPINGGPQLNNVNAITNASTANGSPSGSQRPIFHRGPDGASFMRQAAPGSNFQARIPPSSSFNPSRATSSPNGEVQFQGIKRTVSEVIDLTLSDDDDDELAIVQPNKR